MEGKSVGPLELLFGTSVWHSVDWKLGRSVD